LTAICLSSLGGNANLDVSKLGVSISQLLDKSLQQGLPYLAEFLDSEEDTSEKDDVSSGAYDEYFKQLEEMNKERKAKEAELTATASIQKTT